MAPTTFADLLANNKRFAASYTPSAAQKSKISSALADTLVITCMDPRVPADALLGADGDKHCANIARNAGGRPQKLLDGVFVAQILMDIKEVVILHHTDCGALHPPMGPPTPENLQRYIANNLTPEKNWPEGAGEALKKLELTGYKRNAGEDDWTVLVNSLKTDCAWLRKSELLRKGVVVKGAIYDMETGEITVIEEA